VDAGSDGTMVILVVAILLFGRRLPKSLGDGQTSPS
jgi:Sec-independent protein translocase protein TatA